MGDNGYEPIDTPLLEETELFVRKAGGDMGGAAVQTSPIPAERLSACALSSHRRSFATSSITKTRSPLPVRWQYGGPVFRYAPVEQGSFRQFTQSGAELVGASGIDADVEIMSLAVSGLRQVGMTGVSAAYRTSGRAALPGWTHSVCRNPQSCSIIGNMNALKSGESDVDALMEHARELGMLRGSVDLELETALESMSAEAAEEFILGALKESMPEPVGRRTTDHIIARLLRKVRQANRAQSFERRADIRTQPVAAERLAA